MPVNRKRRSSAPADARRQIRRRKVHARFHNMVMIAEHRITAMAKQAGRVYCFHPVRIGTRLVDTPDMPHVGTPEPVMGECGGRLRPVKIAGKVQPFVRCNRCGRDEDVTAIKAHLGAEAAKVNAVIEAEQAADAVVCRTCAGAAVIEYRNTEGTEYSEPCPDCTENNAAVVLPQPETGTNPEVPTSDTENEGMSLSTD